MRDVGVSLFGGCRFAHSLWSVDEDCRQVRERVVGFAVDDAPYVAFAEIDNINRGRGLSAMVLKDPNCQRCWDQIVKTLGTVFCASGSFVAASPSEKT